VTNFAHLVLLELGLIEEVLSLRVSVERAMVENGAHRLVLCRKWLALNAQLDDGVIKLVWAPCLVAHRALLDDGMMRLDRQLPQHVLLASQGRGALSQAPPLLEYAQNASLELGVHMKVRLMSEAAPSVLVGSGAAWSERVAKMYVQSV